jgi:hypothetical protein
LCYCICDTTENLEKATTSGHHVHHIVWEEEGGIRTALVTIVVKTRSGLAFVSIWVILAKVGRTSLTWFLGIVGVELGRQPHGDGHLDDKEDRMEQRLFGTA